MKTIETLQIRDILYDATINGVIWYEYICPIPVTNQEYKYSYHILLDKRFEKLERFYKDSLQVLLDKNLNSYEEAKQYQISLLEDRIKSIKNE